MTPEEIKSSLKIWASELGFDELRVTDTDVSAYVENHKRCIEQGLHGEMRYLERNQELRYYPRNLVPGTQRVICLRMNCLPPVATRERLLNKTMAYIARYALGRDYHKVMRKRLSV